jgi:hypothetical protein
MKQETNYILSSGKHTPSNSSESKVKPMRLTGHVANVIRQEMGFVSSCTVQTDSRFEKSIRQSQLAYSLWGILMLDIGTDLSLRSPLGHRT